MEFSVYQQYLKSRACKGKDSRHEDFTSLPPSLFLMLGAPRPVPTAPVPFHTPASSARPPRSCQHFISGSGSLVAAIPVG